MADPGAFRAFEHAGWEKLPSRYHDAFANLTTQSIEPLLDAVGARSGTRLLDVATGPGYIAAELPFADGSFDAVTMNFGLLHLGRPERALFEIMLGSTVRTGGLLRAQTPEALEAIRADIRDAVAAHQRAGAIELPMPAVLASAIKRMNG